MKVKLEDTAMSIYYLLRSKLKEEDKRLFDELTNEIATVAYLAGKEDCDDKATSTDSRE